MRTKRSGEHPLALEEHAQLFALEVLHDQGEAAVFGLLEGEDLDDVVVGRAALQANSRLKRATATASSATSAWRILSATLRPSRVSMA